MNGARIIVLTIAIGAGGVAACLASGSDSKPAPPAEPVAQLQTVDALVAKADIGLGQTVTPNEMVWQIWPAANASNAFIHRSDRPEATKEIAGSIARSPFDDRSGQRGSINVVRYGVTSSTAVQK